jgi:hypothetical protein
MRRVHLFIVLAGLSYGASALAEDRRPGKPKTFQPTELTEKEREEAKTRARYKIGTWQEAEADAPEAPFPWMPVGFTLLTLAVVAPFAWSAYRRTAKELEHVAEVHAPVKRRARPAEEEQENQ